MKRFFAVLFALFLCLSFSGCSNKNVPNNKDLGINETAVFENLKITATELSEADSAYIFVPKEGDVFVGIKFTIENISSEEQDISSLFLFNGYVDDVKCDYSLVADSAFEGGSLDGTIAPGRKLVGWYGLEVPKDWSVIEIRFRPDWLSKDEATFVFTK